MLVKILDISRSVKRQKEFDRINCNAFPIDEISCSLCLQSVSPYVLVVSKSKLSAYNFWSTVTPRIITNGPDWTKYKEVFKFHGILKTPASIFLETSSLNTLYFAAKSLQLLLVTQSEFWLVPLTDFYLQKSLDKVLVVAMVNGMEMLSLVI